MRNRSIIPKTAIMIKLRLDFGRKIIRLMNEIRNKRISTASIILFIALSPGFLE